jgi:hypothetical protein
MNDALITLSTTLFSGVTGAALALAGDRWRTGRVRKQTGREALQDFQRVLADRSSFMVITEAGLDETPLEEVTNFDVATARRAAYAYRGLLRPADRELVERSSVPFERSERMHLDPRQESLNQWALDLQGAIDRAF